MAADAKELVAMLCWWRRCHWAPSGRLPLGACTKMACAVTQASRKARGASSGGGPSGGLGVRGRRREISVVLEFD